MNILFIFTFLHQTHSLTLALGHVVENPCHASSLGLYVFTNRFVSSITWGEHFLVSFSVCIRRVSNCTHLCLFIPVPQGLTITAVSSLREGSVSAGWGPRAESLLLLTNRGVSMENIRTHTHLICAGRFQHFPLSSVLKNLVDTWRSKARW